MASTSAANLHNSNPNIPKSRFQTTVCLEDWWLVKAENDLQGTRLAVAGHTIGGKQPMRFFSSLPILKRYDVFTLETTDGICVIIKGFINKARSAENGFSSDVCNHFVYGFPSYWKEYAEKFMVKESPAVEDDPLHVGSSDNDLGSQDTRDADNMHKNKATKPSAVPLLQTSENVISDSEKTPNLSGSPSGGKETFGGSIVQECTTQHMPVNCLKSTLESLTSSSSFGGQIKIPALSNKDVDDSQIHENRASLSACHLNTRSRSRHADDSMKKVKLDQKSSTVLSTDSTSRAETRSRNRLKKKQKNDETSAVLSGDSELGSGNNVQFEVAQLNGSTDKMRSRELDVGSVKDNFEKTLKTPKRGKDRRKVRTEGVLQKKTKPIRSLGTPAAADNEKQAGVADNRSAKAPNMSATRKLVYETPESKTDNVSSNSPQSLSFKRSRSGRLLMPPLAFWRNQTAVYNEDGMITGIGEGIHLGQPRKGSKSTPRRGRRQQL